MMTTLICGECSEPKTVTSRSVVLPFICDGCQKDNELLAAMAPATALVGKTVTAVEQTPTSLNIETSDNVPCDCTPADEATNLLIEDLQNQLDITKNEAEILRQTVTFLEGREVALMNQVETLAKQAETLGVEKVNLATETAKSFFEAFFLKITNSALQEKLKGLRKEVFMGMVRYRGLREEFNYAAKRLFELAGENGKLQSQVTTLDKAGKALGKLYEDSQEELNIAYKARDVWQRRAEFAKRMYDRVSADRRYYRDKCREAGIKA